MRDDRRCDEQGEGFVRCDGQTELREYVRMDDTTDTRCDDDSLRTYALPFAAWELRLFLDTHPTDQAALRQYAAVCSRLRSHADGACVPGSTCSAARWTWIDDPWPWDYTATADGRCAYVDL